MKKTYLMKQEDWLKENGVEVGVTRVKVAKEAESHKDGWNNTWIGKMTGQVGSIGTVTSVEGYSGIGVDVGEGSCSGDWKFPFFTLEVVK